MEAACKMCDCVKVRKVFESTRQEVGVWALRGVWSCTGEIAQSYQLRHMRVQQREDVQRNDICMDGDGGELTGVVTSGRKLSRQGWRRARDSTGVEEECKSWRSEESLRFETGAAGRRHRMGRKVDAVNVRAGWHVQASKKRRDCGEKKRTLCSCVKGA